MAYTFTEYMKKLQDDEVENKAKEEYDKFFEERKNDIRDLLNLMLEHWGVEFKYKDIEVHEHDAEMYFKSNDPKKKGRLFVIYHASYPLNNEKRKESSVYCNIEGNIKYQDSKWFIESIRELLDDMKISGITSLIKRQSKE